MAPVTQDIVLFIKPSENLSLISCKGGKMALNRFCIDEEMANKCTGAFYLSETKIMDFWRNWISMDFWRTQNMASFSWSWPFRERKNESYSYTICDQLSAWAILLYGLN